MKADRKARKRAGKTTRKTGRKSTRKSSRKKTAKGSNNPLWIQADSEADTSQPAQNTAIKGEIQAFRSEIEVLGLKAVSVRQVFYQLETRGLVPKEENGYTLVGRYLTEMREDGVLPFPWISDATRWRRELRMYSNPRQFITDSMRGYLRDPWQDIDARVESWLEKEAMASVFTEVTEDRGVALMVTKGYPSLSFVQQAGHELDWSDDDSPAYLYYFGDHDPSGRDIARDRPSTRGCRTAGSRVQ